MVKETLKGLKTIDEIHSLHSQAPHEAVLRFYNQALEITRQFTGVGANLTSLKVAIQGAAPRRDQAEKVIAEISNQEVAAQLQGQLDLILEKLSLGDRFPDIYNYIWSAIISLER